MKIKTELLIMNGIFSSCSVSFLIMGCFLFSKDFFWQGLFTFMISLYMMLYALTITIIIGIKSILEKTMKIDKNGEN